ncbi:MAG TPA: phosphatidate cytidylyltransferase [Limnochorda sp.]
MKRPGLAGQPQSRPDSSLKARVMTAVIGGPLVLAALWTGGLAWLVVVALVGLLGAPELGRLYGRDRWHPPLDVLFLAVLWPIGFAYAASEGLTGAGLPGVVAVLVVPLVYGLLRELFRPEPHLLSAAAAAAVTVLYWGGLLAHLILLRALPQGFEYGLLLVAGTWGADMAAYFAGRRWGRRRLAPRLSPGKTWEGTAAGLVAGLASAWGVGRAAGLPALAALAAGAAVVVAAPLGDLIESGFKREAGVKDSGTLLPGHGGLLDRFDSLILAGTVLFYWVVGWQALF